MATGHIEYHSVPEIVINRDGPEERRIAFVDDFDGTMQLSTQQLRNLITLRVSEDFWLITGLLLRGVKEIGVRGRIPAFRAFPRILGGLVDQVTLARGSSSHT